MPAPGTIAERDLHRVAHLNSNSTPHAFDPIRSSEASTRRTLGLPSKRYMCLSSNGRQLDNRPQRGPKSASFRRQAAFQRPVLAAKTALLMGYGLGGSCRRRLCSSRANAGGSRSDGSTRSSSFSRRQRGSSGSRTFTPSAHTGITNVYRATKELFLAQRFPLNASPLTTTAYTHP